MSERILTRRRRLLAAAPRLPREECQKYEEHATGGKDRAARAHLEKLPTRIRRRNQEPTPSHPMPLRTDRRSNRSP